MLLLSPLNHKSTVLSHLPGLIRTFRLLTKIAGAENASGTDRNLDQRTRKLVSVQIKQNCDSVQILQTFGPLREEEEVKQVHKIRRRLSF